MTQLDLDSLGEVGSDQQKMIQNCKILLLVQENISKDPDKFDTLSQVLETLEYKTSSEKLKGNTT